jgi:hypothetical protein
MSSVPVVADRLLVGLRPGRAPPRRVTSRGNDSDNGAERGGHTFRSPSRQLTYFAKPLQAQVF